MFDALNEDERVYIEYIMEIFKTRGVSILVPCGSISKNGEHIWSFISMYFISTTWYLHVCVLYFWSQLSSRGKQRTWWLNCSLFPPWLSCFIHSNLPYPGTRDLIQIPNYRNSHRVSTNDKRPHRLRFRVPLKGTRTLGSRG
jgi:hypothetical protein